MPVQETFGDNKKCSICKLSDIDSLNYGEIHGKKELTVHLFCLYFSSNLVQKGSDNAGIVGFELWDIRNFLKTECGKNCCYCHSGSATTYCHYPNCNRVFHQVCGFKMNARFEYLDNFRSFCDRHNRIENDPIALPEYVGCYICLEQVGDYNPVTTIPSCCGGWFHQQCLRKYAINAGYAFKCPLCKNKNFGNFARRHGIYVPEYEALWEKTHDYRDIEREYERCDAKKCICPEGRNFFNHKWKLQLCSCCGSYGLHKLCRPKSEREDIIVCDICINVEQRLTQPQIENQSNENGKEFGDVVMVEYVLEESNNVLDKNIMSNVPEETLEEKRRREKALRPIQNEMRNYRIGLWFRDYERYEQIKD